MSTEPLTITCPQCGAQNRPESVFCAECGTMLSQSDKNDANTTSFIPTPDGNNHDQPDNAWSSSESGTTQIFTPKADHHDQPSDITSESPWAPPPPPPVSYTYRNDPGRRGFVLGMIATILILLVFGFFLWSTVASSGFRDAITGLF